MGETSIEWTRGDDGTPGKTWNPIRGCSRVSPGCENCYAELMAARYCGPGQAFDGFAIRIPGKNGKTVGRWTRRVALVPKMLDLPLRWRKPRRVFVNSMSDLFHEDLSNEDIAAVFGVMAAAPQHTFQVLTKRPERAREWFAWAASFIVSADDRRYSAAVRCAIQTAMRGVDFDYHGVGHTWPLPNVWLGVSAENQETADERIPILLETPAAVRFVSYEPALGPVVLPIQLWRCACGWLGAERQLDTRGQFNTCPECGASGGLDTRDGERISWVIAGSESGPRARPAELEWFRSVRDQCAAAGVPYFFKQWVGFPGCTVDEFQAMGPAKHGKVSLPVLDGRQHAEFPR